MIFNLVPIPPLDGSKVLYAFLPDRYMNFKIWLERWGIIILLIILLFFPGFLTGIYGLINQILTYIRV
jgi:Zn-dependent protease